MADGKLDMTKKEFDLLAKHLKDRIWRLENIYKILDKNGNPVTFELRPAQKFILQNIWYATLILKTRRIGSTTFWCILFLDTCLFNPDCAAGIVAHTENDAHEILENKVKYAYNNLPDVVKLMYPVTIDRKDKLAFSNGSSLYCDRSMRGGTLQYLLITEYGKMCAKNPELAKEVKTGAFNTVTSGQFLVVESTAEGEAGYYFDYCQEAMRLAYAKAKLNPMQFKFLFLGWHMDPDNVLTSAGTVITKEDAEYFTRIEAEINELADNGHIPPLEGRKLSLKQRAWYVSKKAQQGDDMHQEFPSTPDEAFKSSAEGCYYRQQFAILHKDQKICKVEYDRAFPVMTGWDFGLDDCTSIWFFQKMRSENRLIHYYENYGEGLEHYVQYMHSLKYFSWGTHFLPHDAGTRRQNKTIESYETMLTDLGLRKTFVVPRTPDLKLDIQVVRNFLVTCWIDESNCAPGIKALQNFRKDWSEKFGKWMDRPRHDENSHAEAAMRSLACGLLADSGHGSSRSNISKRKKPNVLAFR